MFFFLVKDAKMRLFHLLQKKSKKKAVTKSVNNSEPEKKAVVVKKTTTMNPSRRPRRTKIPPKPNYSLNLWGIMKNCIGKELSKIPMPVS